MAIVLRKPSSLTRKAKRASRSYWGVRIGSILWQLSVYLVAIALSYLLGRILLHHKFQWYYYLSIPVLLVLASGLAKRCSNASAMEIASKEAAVLTAGAQGELQVAQVLTELSNDYVVINDITLHAGGRTAQIDHLVFGPNGVFHIETKNISGDLVIAPGKWTRRKRHGAAEEIGSPAEQAQRHGAVVREWLMGMGSLGSVPVHAVVCIAHPKTSITGIDHIPIVKVYELKRLITATAGHWPKAVDRVQVAKRAL